MACLQVVGPAEPQAAVGSGIGASPDSTSRRLRGSGYNAISGPNEDRSAEPSGTLDSSGMMSTWST